MMDESQQRLSTQRKALTLNRDHSRYGTFAEIGAGQEVARWFFRVGGAAGTVAKSMSAYDMIFSDSIYGTSPQYVSRQRLNKMLEHEYKLLDERLNNVRGEATHFFVYANTVKAISYLGSSSDSHGWMGVRFQSHPRGQPNDVIMHVWMHDRSNVLQQEALGIIGVNLIYGCLYHHDKPDFVVSSLLDDLDRERIEVDMIEFKGPDLNKMNNQGINLELVRQRLTSSVVFAPDRSNHQASEILYKRPILIERGKFRPVTKVNLEMMEAGKRQFLKELPSGEAEPIEIMEISVQNLLGQDDFDQADFLARIDILNEIGKTVMISNRPEFHRLAAHLRRNTKKPIGIVLGLPLLREIFDEKYYQELDGGLLEAFGRLFKRDLCLFTYPILAAGMGEVVNASAMKINPHLGHLLSHLLDTKSIIDIETDSPLIRFSSSQQVTDKIAQGDKSWEEMVIPKVATIIKDRGYYGYQG
jgi:hypothetical protein